MTSRPAGPVTDVRAIKVRPGRRVALPEKVATEEPLEIRAGGRGQVAAPVAVTMRTPGHDFELAAGFLVTEGLVSPAEITGIGYCDAVEDPEQRFNTVTVSLCRAWDPGSVRRDFVASASCGVCGKQQIDQVELSCAVLAPGPVFEGAMIAALPDRLRAAQRVFDQTGGLHAAGLFDETGALLCLREDVGRHNAVDKVVGQQVIAQQVIGQQARGGRVLMVSGRVSFEITQKAAMAGIPVIAAVSAPTSLAVRAADRLGVTLAGFVRDGTYNLYSHPERVAFGPD